MNLFIVPFIAGFLALSRAQPFCYESFEGHTVLSIKHSTDDQVQALLELENQGFDFWTSPSRVAGTVDVRITPEQAEMMEAFLKEHKLEYTVMLQDIGQKIAEEKERLAKRSIFKAGSDPSKLTLNEFHDLQEIYEYLNSVASVYNETVSLFSPGKSNFGKSLTGVKIGNPGSNKTAAFFHGCLHSREWIGCSTMLYIINELTQNAYQYKHILDKMDIYILPVANPDGYETTWTWHRLWRKTLSGPYENNGQLCLGVDPNRNFGYKFKVSGYSNNPCSDLYAGPSAFSEVETQAIRNFLVSHRDTLKTYVDVHAYGELFVYPYGHARVYPEDVNSLKKVAYNATTAMNAINNAKFKYGSIVDVVYSASGSSIDYAKGHLGIDYTYALELRPELNAGNGLFGFLVDFDQIIPGAKECWTGLQVVLDAVLSES